jgi:hypothetical protein
MGFQQSVYEATVYRRGRGHSVLLVGAYVDDLVITGTEEAGVEAFKAQMKASFSDERPRSSLLLSRYRGPLGQLWHHSSSSSL